MYIDADTIIKAASLLGAIGALVAAIVSVYKVIESNKKQSEFINAIQEEQTLICYGLRGALQGLVEQGCNGPCKDALDKPKTQQGSSLKSSSKVLEWIRRTEPSSIHFWTIWSAATRICASPFFNTSRPSEASKLIHLKSSTERPS